MSLSFGIFDHLDRGGVPLGEFYRERLDLLAFCDTLGFYSYHVAEHHGTPLGMAPSPGIFLSAVAQHTQRIRFGPLVYLLPFYHPIRLAEEIAMLDQLSGGRLDVGIGRGISPLETALYGRDPATSQAVYDEALAILRTALTERVVNVDGTYFTFHDATLMVEPVQKPMPPLWYGISSVGSAERCARDHVNVISLSATPVVAEIATAYKAAALQAGRPDLRVGLGRFVIVADTDAAAAAIAEPAYVRWHDNFHYLYHKNHRSPVQGERPRSWASAQEAGLGIAGSPATVLDFLAREVRTTGVNYLMTQFIFGDMPLAAARRSIELYAAEVMPALRALNGDA